MPETRPTITIKLKPYLQEFISSELKDSKMASSELLIGMLIRPFLQLRPKNVAPFIPKGPEYFTFELPLYERFDLRCNYYINVRDQKVIETLLNVHFKRLFYNYMKDKVRFDRHNFQLCIYQFCSDYNFSYNHINYEMLKKTFYRARKKDPNYKNFTNKSSQDSSRKFTDHVPTNDLNKFPFLSAEKWQL